LRAPTGWTTRLTSSCEQKQIAAFHSADDKVKRNQVVQLSYYKN